MVVVHSLIVDVASGQCAEPYEPRSYQFETHKGKNMSIIGERLSKIPRRTERQRAP